MSRDDEYQLTFGELSNTHVDYNYVVIVAKYHQDLIWIRQKGRETWEIPGGHVEPNELPEQAALRELVEETGAVNYKLIPLCDFSIETKDGSSFNRLFFADILEMGPLGDYEIEEVLILNEIPTQLTHGSIQPRLIAEAKNRMTNLLE